MTEQDHKNMRDMVKRHEGCRLTPYHCSEGKLTIGYGRNIEDRGITLEEAAVLLDTDLRLAADIARAAVGQECWDTLGGPRQSVLTNMAFNLGGPRLRGFKKMIGALQKPDYPEAALEMLDSRWAKQVGSRATELRDIMLKGTF